MYFFQLFEAIIPSELLMAGSPELYWGGCTGARGIRCTGGGRVGSECPSKVRDSNATGDGVREGGGGRRGLVCVVLVV